MPRTTLDTDGAVLRELRRRGEREGEGFWGIFQTTAGQRVRGNAVPDAHIAALMRQHGVTTIYTRDRDYRRFDGIRVRDPFGWSR